MGEHDTSDSVADRHNISAITQHPSYNHTTADFDVSILTLAVPINASSKASKICLPASASSLFVGEEATVTGWGDTSSGGSPSPTLQQANVTVVANEQCVNAYGNRINRSVL